MTEEEKADVLPLPLKKPEIIRRFDRHGKTLAKTQKKTGLKARGDKQKLMQLFGA
jgi:hypothetical protein